MSSYVSEYPNVNFDPAFKSFYEDFYLISDTPDAHEKYVQQFTQDATLIMASKTAKGHDGVSSIFNKLHLFIGFLSHENRNPIPS